MAAPKGFRPTKLFVAGARQNHRAVGYDPTTGKPYRLTATMEPAVAAAVVQWSELSGKSIAWLLNEAAKHVLTDPATGLPTFLPPQQSSSDDMLPFDERTAC